MLNWFYSLHPALILTVGLVISPGLMFVIGWIFESRTIAVFRDGQSRQFLPGDIGLAFVLAGVAYGQRLLPENPGAYYAHPAYPFVVFALTAAIVVVMRCVVDAPYYAPRARHSPTKWYHDVGCYGFLGALILIPSFPFLTSCFGPPLPKEAVFVWCPVVAGLFTWLGGLFIDMHKGGRHYKTEVRHPDDWQPIWHKKRK
jgi:hypothetical protein